MQHPSLYSHEGLEDAKHFLSEFIDKNVSFEEHDKRNKERLSSNVRKWNIEGTPENYASYKNPFTWEITSGDIMHDGLTNYVENVKKWGKSILRTLKESDNFY